MTDRFEQNEKETKPPIEGKVYNSTIGSGIGVVLTPFILWLLGVTIWRVPITAGSEFAAITAVPGVIAAPIGVLVTMGSSFLGGYLAKHTPRPEITEALSDLEEEEEDISDDVIDHDLPEGEAPDVDDQDLADPMEGFVTPDEKDPRFA